MRAKKSLGQNFLADAGVAARIVREFGPRAGETVVEIGPGRGALTAQLVGRVGRVVAVELDRELIPVLRNRFGAREDFTVVEADALAADFCQLIAPAREARVVANLPYYISTAVLQRLIAQRACLSEMILMLQREVVERITARAGERERGYLSVLVEAYCEAEHLFDVPPTAFRPAPKVWSALVRLRVRQQWPAGEAPDESVLWALVSAGFSQRRKTIFNNLRQAGGALGPLVEGAGGAAELLAQAGVDPQRRAETLTLAEWSRLARGL
ncbi:MAG: 16S rRNA (adenine(1518)-N(6)/adenine(1519)-N(6))-dimethyltransferase RsmA [Pyrinomonadaceae bacterium]